MYVCMYEIEFKDEKLMQTDEQVHILALQNWNRKTIIIEVVVC